jgi:hypothetical protein
VNFYEVGGLLVRRARHLRRGVGAEVWQGDGWAEYADLDAVLRQGHRLTDEAALALLKVTRGRIESLTQLSDSEAHLALRAPRKRNRVEYER